MSGWVTAGAYGVSAGLVIYGLERDYIDHAQGFAYIIGWAVAGLVLSLLAVLIRKRED